MSVFATPEQFAATQRASIEAMLTLANTAFVGAERIAALNLNTARSLLEDSVANTKALMGAKNVQELVTLQASLAKPSLEKAVAYSKSIYDISSEFGGELSKIVEVQVSEANRNVSAVLDKAAKSAPAGSDVAVAAVKSAIAAANSAYDSLTKAARQVATLTEANVAAATNATVNAVGASSATVAKTAKKAA